MPRLPRPVALAVAPVLDAGLVGDSASHGCIRMSMPDVEALYPMVPTVFVTRGGPPRPLGGGSSGSADAADGG